MPAIAALTINDGAPTPVAHVFTPGRTDGSKATWSDNSSATFAGRTTLSDEVRTPASGTGAIRRIVELYRPVEATVGGVTKVARFSRIQVVFNHSQEGTKQERLDDAAYVANYLTNATVKAAIGDAEPWY